MVVLDLERFEKIKASTELRVGGLWWVLNEKKQTNVRGKRHRAYAVVGLDLVKVQILIPVLPLCLSHPLSSSPVPRKTDLSTLKKRKEKRPQHQQHT